MFGNLTATAMTVRKWAIESGRIISSRSRTPEPLQGRADIAVVGIEAAELLGLGLLLVPDESGEEIFLVGEIDVERALRHARSARDFVHAGAVEAVGQEDSPRPIEDLTPLGAFLADRKRRRIRFGAGQCGSLRHRGVLDMTEPFGHPLI